MINNNQDERKADLDCPRCLSSKIWKDGLRKVKSGFIQRFLCRDCGYRFSGSLIFSAGFDIIGERQVCATSKGAKNLIVAKQELATGEISETKSILFELLGG